MLKKVDIPTLETLFGLSKQIEVLENSIQTLMTTLSQLKMQYSLLCKYAGIPEDKLLIFNLGDQTIFWEDDNGADKTS